MPDALFWGVNLFIAAVLGFGAVVGFQIDDNKSLGVMLIELHMALVVAAGQGFAIGRENNAFLVAAIMLVLIEAVCVHINYEFPKKLFAAIANFAIVVLLGIVYGRS